MPSPYWLCRRAQSIFSTWDDEMPGFGVRLRLKSKRWVIQYRINGRQRRESLGDVRKVTLEDARKIARQRFAQVELGSDPVAERAAAAARLTLGAAAARYLDAKREVPAVGKLSGRDEVSQCELEAAARSCVEGRQALRRGCTAAGINQAERVELPPPGPAIRCRRCSHGARREGLCEFNPAIGTNDPATGILPRDRILSDEELRIIWNACADDAEGRVIKLLLFTRM